MFKAIDIPPLTPAYLAALHQAAADMDWRAIDPTIFGTLFERAQLGANYTGTATIDKIITPLITAPLMAEWQATCEKIATQMRKASAFDEAKAAAVEVKVTAQAKKEMERKLAAAKTASTKALNEAGKLYTNFLLRLNKFRVLDPACGSGDFLYLALKALRAVEKRAQIEAQELGLQAETELQTGPHNILGLEINEFAAELARVTVWIGDIQWCRRNGYAHATHPILKPLESIEHRDALMNPDGSEAQWPEAEVIVGNPPFLGGSKKRGELGGDYLNALAKTFTKDRVPPGADLVCYWFDKARIQIETGKCQRAGLVATNSMVVRREPNRAGAYLQNLANIHRLERRAMGKRRRSRARFVGVFYTCHPRFCRRHSRADGNPVPGTGWPSRCDHSRGFDLWHRAEPYTGQALACECGCELSRFTKNRAI